MVDEDKFFRDIVYKMMGFGIIVLITYFGWMTGTGDKEKFIAPWVSDPNLEAKAKEIALRTTAEGSGEYLNKFESIQCAMEMRKDRGLSLIGFFIGSLIWTGSILWAFGNIQDLSDKTVPKKWIVYVYCALILVPQIVSMYMIFKDYKFTS